MQIKTVQLYSRQRRAALIWVALVLLTFGSWLWAENMSLTNTIMASIITLAILKVALVIAYYMEIHLAPLWLKLLCSAWLIMVLTVILLCHLSPDWVAHV